MHIIIYVCKILSTHLQWHQPTLINLTIIIIIIIGSNTYYNRHSHILCIIFHNLFYCSKKVQFLNSVYTVMTKCFKFNPFIKSQIMIYNLIFYMYFKMHKCIISLAVRYYFRIWTISFLINFFHFLKNKTQISILKFIISI